MATTAPSQPTEELRWATTAGFRKLGSIFIVGDDVAKPPATP